MKETMETLKCKAVHVAAGAAQTARLVALISKKKFAILAEQDKIRRCYTQLGKVYYKDYVTDEEPDDAEYDPLCERISQSFRRINRLRQELEAAKTKLAGEQPEDEANPRPSLRRSRKPKPLRKKRTLRTTKLPRPRKRTPEATAGLSKIPPGRKFRREGRRSLF